MLRHVYLASKTSKCTYGMREESNFTVEICTNIRGGFKGEFEGQPLGLVNFTAPNIREYLYTFFDSPRLGLRRRVNQMIHGVDHPRSHARMHASNNTCWCGTISSMSAHACRIMHACTLQQEEHHACRVHAGSCMPVHA